MKELIIFVMVVSAHSIVVSAIIGLRNELMYEQHDRTSFMVASISSFVLLLSTTIYLTNF